MVKNAIFGLAIGDALGVPAEFQERASLMLHPITTMIGGGFHGQPAGTWSDDTSMSLCLMASIAAYHRLEPDDISLMRLSVGLYSMATPGVTPARRVGLSSAL